MKFTRQPGPDYAATLTIDAPAETIYAALTTADGIRSWWTASTEGDAAPGGEFRVEFPAHDVYKIAKVEAGPQPGSVRWQCTDCKLEDWIGTTMDFVLTPAGPGGTELAFTHHGLRPQLDCFESCQSGWDFYLRSLGSYAETGTGQPSRD
jgi:uncharacterized protein YndB with AHSA1/START domain